MIDDDALYAEAERSVLGAMLLPGSLGADARQAATSAGLASIDFKAPKHGWIYNAVICIDGGPFDAVLVAEHLATAELLDQCGGIEYLHQLQNGVNGETPCVSCVRQHAGVIQRHATRRRFEHLTAELTSAVGTGDNAEIRRLLERLERLANQPATDRVELRFVTLPDFAAVDEPGSAALLGDGTDALVPANGDVMVYGDGGAGKTTLCLDAACHLAAGNDWLGIPVAGPVSMLLIENEGPRALFRDKVRRKLDAWAGAPLGDRVGINEEPWATFTFANEAHRIELARQIADHDADLVIVDPSSPPA